MDILDELRQKSEKRFKELQDNPELWRKREDISQDIISPEVGHLVADFLAGDFNFQDFFKLSTSNREEFIYYLEEEFGIHFTLTLQEDHQIPA